jgi:hypothetical protein
MSNQDFAIWVSHTISQYEMNLRNPIDITPPPPPLDISPPSPPPAPAAIFDWISAATVQANWPAPPQAEMLIAAPAPINIDPPSPTPMDTQPPSPSPVATPIFDWTAAATMQENWPTHQHNAVAPAPVHQHLVGSSVQFSPASPAPEFDIVPNASPFTPGQRDLETIREAAREGRWNAMAQVRLRNKGCML